jgi:hypothetical protein
MEPESSQGAGIKLTTEPDESTPCPPIMFYDIRIHFSGLWMSYIYCLRP